MVLNRGLQKKANAAGALVASARHSRGGIAGRGIAAMQRRETEESMRRMGPVFVCALVKRAADGWIERSEHAIRVVAIDPDMTVVVRREHVRLVDGRVRV